MSDSNKTGPSVPKPPIEKGGPKKNVIRKAAPSVPTKTVDRGGPKKAVVRRSRPTGATGPKKGVKRR